METPRNNQAWIISVNMGYGHQRTAYPLKDLSPDGKIVNANDYKGIPAKDRAIWEGSRKFYEFISNFKKIPLVGGFSFSLFNQLQKILNFYPKRDLSKPNISLDRFYALFKGGWGKDLIEKLSKKPLPLVSTFFLPAFMAEFFNYPGEIFCTVCDADIARSWAPLNPAASRINYFVPTEVVAERLKMYGVKEENIHFSGYPLPLENIGSVKMEILKKDLAQRLLILDPKKKYFERYEPLIRRYLGQLPERPARSLTLMFAVGGAGAQREIGFKIIKSLRGLLKNEGVRVFLVAGIKKEVKEYFSDRIGELGLKDLMGKNLKIIFNENIYSYFHDFNEALRETDILWTKPSEMSFYTALGLPIILAPCIGSQEEFNKKWLLRLGSALSQENPNFTDEWLFDLLREGWFAEAAMQGFVEGEKRGVFNIKETIFSHR